MASLLLNFARHWWRTGVTDRRYGTLPNAVTQLSGSGGRSSKVECAIYPLRVVTVQVTARIQECTPSKDAVNKALVIDLCLSITSSESKRGRHITPANQGLVRLFPWSKGGARNLRCGWRIEWSCCIDQRELAQHS